MALLSFVYLAALFGATGLTVALLVPARVRAAVPLLLALTAAGTVLCVVAAGLARYHDRRTTGPLPREARTALARAVRTGELPDDPALDGPLLALLERDAAARDRLRRWRFVLVPVLLAWLAVIVYTGEFRWGPFLGILVTSVFSAFLQRGRRDALRRLETAVRARLGEEAT
ncbi:hypothetical protein [Actinomadura parmotrematis]|uniref:Integral membrane protein n=1 Tax=Actinomadura parmotrematis TaxID=2864039 RepID=A0ABS7FZ05_9ACTN|nr:hypothetical protein [Actinomadura parmotrematis]MBW8484673.1 hypothetical protein [Actinomadura parmotrematis]